MSETKSTTALAIRGETSTAVALREPSVGFVQLDTIADAISFAQFIAKSELVPEAYRNKPADIVIAMQMGMELGFSPLQSLQTIAVIKGRPGIYGDGIPALIVGQRECEDFHEQEAEGSDEKAWVATCTIKRRGRSPVVRRFSYDDAKRAGLWGKSGPWTTNPRRMLQMRARGFAARDAFADVLKGIKTREELEDYPDESPAIAEPKRIGESSTVPAVSPAETAPADSAAAAPVPPTAQTQAAAPSPSTTAPADQSLSGVSVVNSSFTRDKDGRALYEVLTSEGTFYTRDESLYSALAVLEGTDHTVTITYRLAKRNGNTARVIVGVAVDEPQAAPAEEGA